MYQMSPDDQIVAADGIQGNSELVEIVMDFTEENRALSAEPTFLTYPYALAANTELWPK